MTGRLLAPRGVAVAVLLVASLFLAVGCGGGGSGGGGGDSKGRDTTAVVLGLQTPLGLQGTRGVGPEVTIIYRLRDREFDRSDVEIEYGLGTGADLDGDGEEDMAWFAASEVPFDPGNPGTSSSGTSDLPGSPGVGTIHYFVWDSLADLGTGRYVTQDYVYTDDGRVLMDEFGDPVFQDFAGARVRIRPVSRNIPGAWKETDAFDVNSNNTPSVSFGDVVIPPEGVADGTVNEDVELNWTAIDPDSDPVTIAVDWAQVPMGFDPSTAPRATLEGLPWQACTTGRIGEGTKSLAASAVGMPHVWSWDSVADAGTMNGYIMFRMRPLDEKLEVGEWDYMSQKFHLDNYTIFTDPDAALPATSAHGRTVLLEDTSVLYVGGTSTGSVPSTKAAIFYPGLSQTTKGNVAEVQPGLNAARMMHTATRLADGTVLVIGGVGTGGTALNTAEVYDPVARSFTLLTAKTTSPRKGHTATLLRGGRVLITGGEDDTGYLDSAEIYDPNTGKFESAGTMGEARGGAIAVRLPAGRVLIAGGTGSLGATNTVEIYDPFAEAFLATDNANAMEFARAGLSLTETTDAMYAAVAAGGVATGTPHSTIERFDWELDGFMTSAVEMQDVRSNHVGVMLGDGKILFAGGSMGGGSNSPTGDIYDVANDTMDTPNGPMVASVEFAAVSCLENGRPVIFGGNDAGAATAQIQIFTPDGGFNYPPVAQVRTPTAVEPWAFGVRFNWRATDQEGDPVRINAQFRVKPSASDDSDKLPVELLDVWLPASMKDQTVLGEVSSGLTGLTSRTDFVTELENPIDAPDVDEGEHLFVWFTEKDIPKGNYDNVFFRILIDGATTGTTATSGRFSITDNAPTIARVLDPITNYGHMVFPFYLQDSDAGDVARLVWEYGIDLNDDGKIVEADFESWVTLTRSKVGVDVGGTIYTDAGLTDLATQPNDFTDADGIPWGKLHHMIWDSVYDLGAPASTRSDIIVRCTPYDYPAGSPGEEALGIDYERGGFDLMMDPNGLTLESWEPTVNNTAGSTYTFEGVKLDEPITFTFTKPVAANSVSRDSIQFTKIGGNGQRIGGYFEVDNSSGKGVVTYYPQVQEIPARTDILEESVGYQLFIPNYDPTNRSRLVVQQDGADPDDTNGRYVLGLISEANAMETGTGVLPDSGAPSASALVSPTGTTGVATDTRIELSFDERIDPSSVTAAGFLVTAEVYAGVSSVVYGDLELRNVTDQSGPGGTVRQYAVLVFQPDTRLPANISKIIINVTTSLTDMAGNNLSSSATTSFTTQNSTTTVTGSFTEGFDDDSNRDSTLTTAFWGTTDPVGIGSGGGLGVSGYLSGMHDLGDGSDGALDLTSGDMTIDTDTKDTWNFTSIKIPVGRTLRLEGSKPANLKCQGDVVIEGTVDASGEPGKRGGGYYDVINPKSGYGAEGGAGGAGGGDGGDVGYYTWKQKTVVSSGNGAVGYGAGTNSNGRGATGAFYVYSSNYDQYGAGASGAGHVQAGVDGSYGYYSGSNYKTPVTGGSSYGYTDLSGGLEAGSGGGAGGSVTIDYSYGSTTYQYDRWGLCSGGGGGGGGGALKLSAGGRISVTKNGRILANGGHGGHVGNYYPYSTIWYNYYYQAYKKKTVYGTYYYPGGGGGGSGGSVWLQAGSGYDLHGELDISGGAGGIARYYQSGSTLYYWCEGGAGGDGRLRLDGPGTLSLSDAVDFKGVVACGENLAISGGSGTTNWSVTSSVSVNTDSGSGAPSGVTFSGGKFYAKDFSVSSAGRITVTGSKPFVVLASGKVSIAGTISAPGTDATDYSTSGAYGSNTGFRAYARLYGPKGVAGGAAGGDNAGSDYTTLKGEPHSGLAGFGTNGALGGTGAGKPADRKPLNNTYDYQTSSSYYRVYSYNLYYFGGGSGGGGSAEAGKDGSNVTGEWTTMKYTGGDHGVGGSQVTNVDTLTDSNITGGAGGAGGSHGGYSYTYQNYNTSGTITYTYKYYVGYGMGVPGGSGGGGVAIISSDTIELSGTINVGGGDGADRYSTSTTYALCSGPGGGGGGGNVLLEAKKGFTIKPGSTIDASGGAGGRAYYNYTLYGFPDYSYGGDGGRGAIVLRAEKKPEFLNVGQAEFGEKGTVATGGFILTTDGVSTWQDTGFHAPAYTGMATTGAATADLYIMGAHIDPMTGQVDESSASQWFDTSTDLAKANGYRFFKFKCVLTGSTAAGKVPEVDSVVADWETYQ